MKKIIIAALVLIMAVSAFCFAEEIDTTEWNMYPFEGSNVMMLLPPDFEGSEDIDSDPDQLFYMSNNDCGLEVRVYTFDNVTLEEIAEEQSSLEYIDSAEVTNINGIDMVLVKAADDDIFLYIIPSPEGTVYEFIFYPFFESENGHAVAQAIAASITPESAV